MTKFKFEFNGEIKIPKKWRDIMPESGPAESAVATIRTQYHVIANEKNLYNYLKRLGCWSHEELLFHDHNIDRLIWVATLDCIENETCWFYGGL